MPSIGKLVICFLGVIAAAPNFRMNKSSLNKGIRICTRRPTNLYIHYCKKRSRKKLTRYYRFSSIFYRRPACMPHADNSNLRSGYSIRNAIMIFFKCSPCAVVIFLELIGREHFWLHRQSVRDGGQLFDNLPGILGRVFTNIVVGFS